MGNPTIEDVKAASVRIAPFVRRTPTLENEALNERLGFRLIVKPECLQRFGAFKARGAFNKISSLPESVRARGLVAFSSGNHAQAVAGAARAFGVGAVIVMPEDAPLMKIEATRAMGAQVVLYDRANEDREAIAAQLSDQRGLTLIKPFDDPDIIAGQGTAGLELAADLDALDACLVCASGGGLSAGVAIAVKAKFPNCAVFPVEPEGHNDIARSLDAGQIVANPPGVRSICDALLVDKMGALPFAIGRQLWAGALGVSDQDVRMAMRVAFSAFKIVLEPGGAAALAAAIGAPQRWRGQTVAIIASGGNVDPQVFAAALIE
jgi:threonine dehydratase